MARLAQQFLHTLGLLEDRFKLTALGGALLVPACDLPDGLSLHLVLQLGAENIFAVVLLLLLLLRLVRRREIGFDEHMRRLSCDSTFLRS